MGKNKRKQIEVDCDLGKFSVDSNEEVAFIHWCEELYKLKLIDIDFNIFYQPDSYELIPKVKYFEGKKERTLLREHNYTLDFIIIMTEELYSLFPALQKYLISSQDKKCYIDIKGTFNKNGGDRTFSINQKLMYNRYELYVNKIIPDKLFQLSFLPEKERYSPKKHQLREKYKDLKTLKEITTT